MDRAHLLEDLVLHSLDSRASAAQVRGQVDSSHFDAYSSLVVLVADHDLHLPDAPPQGPLRRASIRAHIEGLLRRATRRGAPARDFAGRDRHAELASTALATFARLADRSPTGEVAVLVAHLLGQAVPPHVPRQSRHDRGGPDQD